MVIKYVMNYIKSVIKSVDISLVLAIILLHKLILNSCQLLNLRIQLDNLGQH